MDRSSDILYKNCQDNILPSHPAIYCYYFGENFEEKQIKAIFKVYQELIKFFGVTSDKLHNAMITGQLEQLIDNAYCGGPTPCYYEFKNMNIELV